MEGSIGGDGRPSRHWGTCCKPHPKTLNPKPHPACQVLLQALRATAEDADSYCATLAAVARFAANDEICRQFADGGCVEDMLAALKRHAGAPTPSATCGGAGGGRGGGGGGARGKAGGRGKQEAEQGEAKGEQEEEDGGFQARIWRHQPLWSPSTQHSAPSTQHSALSTRHSALGTQHSALSTQHLALSTQHPALSTQNSALSTSPAPSKPLQHAWISNLSPFSPRSHMSRLSRLSLTPPPFPRSLLPPHWLATQHAAAPQP
eukprot:314090-Chlamydomonas_euryale.AAC.1